jgi:hypothetical protein
MPQAASALRTPSPTGFPQGLWKTGKTSVITARSGKGNLLKRCVHVIDKDFLM